MDDRQLATRKTSARLDWQLTRTTNSLPCRHLVCRSWEIVLICDDSGSMNTPLNNSNGSAFAKSVSRWDELKQTVSIIVDIAAVMDKDGECAR